jgi:hypothetical protein
MLGRRAAISAAGAGALFLGVTAAEAAGMAAPRKADQSAIGVSRVTIPSKGKGSPGASIPEVPLDTSGWQGKEAVVGPNGAAGGSIKNKSLTSGFFAGGESEAEKQAIMKQNKGA